MAPLAASASSTTRTVLGDTLIEAIMQFIVQRANGRGRGKGLTPYPPTLRVARHQAAYPLPPYPKTHISSQEFVTSSSMKTLLSARAWRSVGRFGASSAVSYPSSIYRTLCQPLVR